MKRSVLALMTLTSILLTSPAFGLFDVELRYGPRWYEEDNDGEKKGAAYTGFTAAGHLGILPIVSFGLSVSQFNMADRDLGAFDSVTITEIGLDVVAALEFIPVITPFGRANFPLSSKGVSKGSGSEAEFNAARIGDMLLSLGIEYSPIPLFGITFEMGHGVVMQNFEKTTVNGNNVLLGDHAKDADAVTMQTVMLGVNFGF